MLALLALIVLAITGYIIRSITKPRNYPPGPRWYPFFGCSTIVQRMSKKHGSQWKGLSEIAKEYCTDVLGLKLGTELVVVVYGEKNIRRIFTEKEFEGRPSSFFIKLRCLGKRLGITFVDGPLWREHRQFTMKHLKNAGFGKTAMEKEIQNEMRTITESFSRNKHKPINPRTILAVSVMNTLWKYIAGENIEEERLIYLLDLLNKRSKAFSLAGGWLNQIPWCRFIMPNLSGYSLIKKLNLQISDVIEETIEKHKQNKVRGQDFIYTFLEELRNDKETYTEEQLKTICLDMLIAGSQTSSNYLEFAILAIIRNSMLQEKIYNEIKTHLGDQTPCWNDTNKLVYTSAFLLEVQRCYPIVPLSGPRRVLDDVTMDEYSIPKETTVLISVGDLNTDPEIWNEPLKFKPERFIDSRGALKNVDRLYSFGMGRRRCPGDSLARSFVFIVFVGIIQKFRIECCNGVMPSDQPIIGLISAPRPFHAEFIERE